MLITAVVPQQCSECARGRSRLQTKVYIDALMLIGHICADSVAVHVESQVLPRTAVSSLFVYFRGRTPNNGALYYCQYKGRRALLPNLLLHHMDPCIHSDIQQVMS